MQPLANVVAIIESSALWCGLVSFTRLFGDSNWQIVKKANLLFPQFCVPTVEDVSPHPYRVSSELPGLNRSTDNYVILHHHEDTCWLFFSSWFRYTISRGVDEIVVIMTPCRTPASLVWEFVLSFNQKLDLLYHRRFEQQDQQVRWLWKATKSRSFHLPPTVHAAVV